VFWTIKTPSRKIKIVPAPFVSVVFSKSDRLLGGQECPPSCSPWLYCWRAFTRR
jgi:hypothetical protein